MPPPVTHKALTAQQIAISSGGSRTAPSTGRIGRSSRRQRPAVPRDRRSRSTPSTTSIASCSTGSSARACSRRRSADKETLISRVTLTLTGLPPTLEEIDAFVADTRPTRTSGVVDRLLASPAYGERMADYWLDLARFAETDGFLDDHHDRRSGRGAIGSSTRSTEPAVRRVRHGQLAGDLLPDATREQLLATAFVRVGKRTTENGTIDEEYRVEYVVDRTDNAVGTAFLGLTVGCARCHDHKYDPIKQTDYYSLGAFFNSTDEPGA